MFEDKTVFESGKSILVKFVLLRVAGRPILGLDGTQFDQPPENVLPDAKLSHIQLGLWVKLLFEF